MNTYILKMFIQSILELDLLVNFIFKCRYKNHFQVCCVEIFSIVFFLLMKYFVVNIATFFQLSQYERENQAKRDKECKIQDDVNLDFFFFFSWRKHYIRLCFDFYFFIKGTFLYRSVQYLFALKNTFPMLSMFSKKIWVLKRY